MEHEDEGDTNDNSGTRNNPQMLGKGTGRIRTQSTSVDHPSYHIITIRQNTEKSPGDLRKLSVTQNPVNTIN